MPPFLIYTLKYQVYKQIKQAFTLGLDLLAKLQTADLA
jgi:hypothetical protein